MLYRLLASVLVLAFAVERLVELRSAGRNRRRLLAEGALEVGAGDYRWMVVLHTAFLISCLAEVWWYSPPIRWSSALPFAILLVAAQILRLWSLRTLGRRWTTRILVLPGESVVAAGPYRWIRHPNYLAVVIEILALPLLLGAWRTALVFSLANGWVLVRRIRSEERALAAFTDYRSRLGASPRLLPWRTLFRFKRGVHDDPP